jgi:hypothetical protein
MIINSLWKRILSNRIKHLSIQVESNHNRIAVNLHSFIISFAVLPQNLSVLRPSLLSMSAVFRCCVARRWSLPLGIPVPQPVPLPRSPHGWGCTAGYDGILLNRLSADKSWKQKWLVFTIPYNPKFFKLVSLKIPPVDIATVFAVTYVRISANMAFGVNSCKFEPDLIVLYWSSSLKYSILVRYPIAGLLIEFTK